MDIKLKMGAKGSLPSTKSAGTVYFARNGSSNFGELHYDIDSSTRVKIGGTNLTSAVFDANGMLTLTYEDGTTKTATIPAASANSYGLLTTGTQTIAGSKTFSGDVSVNKLTITNTGTP